MVGRLREVGLSSKAEEYRDVQVKVSALTEDPALRTVEFLPRARRAGYTGGKSALYTLPQTLRDRTVTPLVRFEGLPGNFSHHDFGGVWVTCHDGTESKVHFFASRLKYSRRVEVTAGPRRAGREARACAARYVAAVGVPRLSAASAWSPFDRPKTVALQ